MIKVPGYRMLHIVYEDDHISITHALSESDARVVLMKAVKAGPRMMMENAKFIHEYELLSTLDVPRILKPCSLLRIGNSMVLLFDIIQSVTLRHYISVHRPVSVEAFFHIAIQLLEVVEQIHSHNIIHLNLRPETILLRPDSLEVWLTGFSESASHQQMPFRSWGEGSPPYMAPERTGRIGKTVDERTDLYSLGITFYEMLSGRLPFHAEGPLEWAYAHAAKQPPHLRDIDHIPPILADIVMRLLSKHPEDRYHSAYGVKADLQRCREDVQSSNEAVSFPLGAFDRLSSSIKIEGNIENAAEDHEGSHLADEESHDLPDSVMTIGKMPLKHGSPAGAQSGYTQMLELAAVLKASRVFVQQTDLDELIVELLKIAMENSGAERALFLLQRDNELFVEHEIQSRHGWSVRNMKQLLKEYSSVFHRAVQQAVRSGQPVLVDDAGGDPNSANDPYVKKHKVKSVMVFPIKLQNNPVCVLYTENNLTAGAFSGRNPELLHMLSVQIMYLKQLQTTANKSSALALETSSILTKRELAVLRLMAAGMSNKEIAAQLKVTSETIKAHVKNIFDKLKVNRRAQAVLAAVKLNILTVGEDDIQETEPQY